VTLITGYKRVRAGGIGAFEKEVVAGVGGDLDRLNGRDEVGTVSNELKNAGELDRAITLIAEVPERWPTFMAPEDSHSSDFPLQSTIANYPL
jgi:hypothetical protein